MRVTKTAFCILLYFFGFLPVAKTQVPETFTSADIYLQLKKLNVLGSVLYIAAHPDDENNGFLPYLAKERMYRTGYLSLTRGDGGQNLIGNEQGVELGLIRSQELIAARRIDGAEQFFFFRLRILDSAKMQAKHCRYGTKKKFYRTSFLLSGNSNPIS
jgi:hypothetical protein